MEMWNVAMESKSDITDTITDRNSQELKLQVSFAKEPYERDDILQRCGDVECGDAEQV